MNKFENEINNLIITPLPARIHYTYDLTKESSSNFNNSIKKYINCENFIFGTSIITLKDINELNNSLVDFSAQAFLTNDLYFKIYTTLTNYKNLIQLNFKLESN